MTEETDLEKEERESFLFHDKFNRERIRDRNESLIEISLNISDEAFSLSSDISRLKSRLERLQHRISIFAQEAKYFYSSVCEQRYRFNLKPEPVEEKE